MLHKLIRHQPGLPHKIKMYRQPQLYQLICQRLAALTRISIDKHFIHHINAHIFQKTVCRRYNRNSANLFSRPVCIHNHNADHFKFLIPVALKIRNTLLRVPLLRDNHHLGKFLPAYHTLADIDFPQAPGKVYYHDRRCPEYKDDLPGINLRLLGSPYIDGNPCKHGAAMHDDRFQLLKPVPSQDSRIRLHKENHTEIHQKKHNCQTCVIFTHARYIIKISQPD